MLRDFKMFAGLPVPGMKAVGLLVISKAAGHENAAFSIPAGTIFRAGEPGFVTIQPYELSESATQIEDGVTAQSEGIAGNVPAGQVWTTNNIIATNPLPFTRGEDAIKPISLTDRLNVPPDAVIQSQLDVAMAQIKNMLGIDADAEPPDAKPVERACYLLAQFYFSVQYLKQLFS